MKMMFFSQILYISIFFSVSFGVEDVQLGSKAKADQMERIRYTRFWYFAISLVFASGSFLPQAEFLIRN